jgi:hypothetical protein
MHNLFYLEELPSGSGQNIVAETRLNDAMDSYGPTLNLPINGFGCDSDPMNFSFESLPDSPQKNHFNLPGTATNLSLGSPPISPKKHQINWPDWSGTASSNIAFGEREEEDASNFPPDTIKRYISLFSMFRIRNSIYSIFFNS